MNNRSNLIFGIILITIGAILLVANLTDYRIGWSYLGPAILIFIGILFFASIKSRQRAGAIFPGIIFFVTGLAFFLTNFSSFYEVLIRIEFHTFVMLVLTVAFLGLYLIRPQEVGLLVPTAVFAMLGALFLLNDFWILDWDSIGRLWPLIPIGIGVAIVIHGLRRKEMHPTNNVEDTN
jgi:hypothetical protein